MGEDVETYWDGEAWCNRVVGGRALPGTHLEPDDAVAAGRDEARTRGVLHVIRRSDGTVLERRRYPRGAADLAP